MSIIKRGSPGGERWLFTSCANILKNKSAQRARTLRKIKKGEEKERRRPKWVPSPQNSNASVINWLVSTDATGKNKEGRHCEFIFQVLYSPFGEVATGRYKCLHVHLKN